MPSTVPALLVTGPGGVGKTTVAFEICRRLEAAGVAHVMIDADELDRIFPPPPGDPHKTQLATRNLAAMWSNFRDVNVPRVVLTMVAASLKEELPRVLQAIPEADITIVRLRASEDNLLDRVREREVGTGYDYQAPRTLEQARLMALEPGEDRLVVETSGRSVVEVACEVLRRADWPGTDVKLPGAAGGPTARRSARTER